MAKTKTRGATHDQVSDTALEELIVFPAAFKVRCDHAGAKLHPDQEPDVHEEPTRPDARELVRHRYEKKCDRFGKVEKVTLNGADDPERVCPSCGFNRTLVEVA